LNLNMLKVQGRSDLVLRLEVYKKILAVPVIIFGILFGMRVLLLGMVVNSFIAYTLNSYWSGKFLNYSIGAQLKDIIPSFMIAISMSVIVYFIGVLVPYGYLATLLIQISIGCFITFGLCEIFRLEAYLIMKDIFSQKIYSKRSKV
jgi:teichuronic acid exporter